MMREAHTSKPVPAGKRGLLKGVLEDGGPGFCQFAITNACNARCRMCGFSREAAFTGKRTFVPTEKACAAIALLAARNIEYLVITGGEPLLHPGLEKIVTAASERGMCVLVVTNAGLLDTSRITVLVQAGVTEFIISVDAMDAGAHEDNRGLPDVCRRIREANRTIAGLGASSTASVTMSRLVDYDAVPSFLGSLGFSAVTFSYPLMHLASSFLGYAAADMVHYGDDELIEAFEQVKRLKKRFAVVNPTPSLEEMQRFLRKEPQQYACLGGYKYFYLDWDLQLWRCHYWDKPLCSVFDYDGSQNIRDGCTRCMIDCYRDASVMHHAGMAVHDAYRSLKALRLREALRTLTSRSMVGALGAVIEELRWIRRL
jgi:MoaA/NifB/PqqE/SkfB family radical SAM enzyme